LLKDYVASEIELERRVCNLKESFNKTQEQNYKLADGKIDLKKDHI
jgi:hypothetical protein